MSAGPVRVFLPCTGLGRERRGFETFTRDCAAALAADPRLEIRVFGGGGDLLPHEREVWNLRRSGLLAGVVSAITGADRYFIEQVSFFAGFAGALSLQKPDLVYFADVNLGNACWHWRRLTRQRYRLLYYNGGPTTRPFTRCDLVQQVSPEHYDSAIARGEDANRQFLLPHGVAIDPAFQPLSPADRAAHRAAYGIPADVPVVLSVGALDASHKRMDHVIDELATMASRPHLVLLGAQTRETPALRERAEARLGGRCTMLTLPHGEVRAMYGAADVFVLASLVEGFGIAQVEALAAGLPCVAHETATSAYVLGPHGVLVDLRVPGILASTLERLLKVAAAADAPRLRHAWARAKFSWDTLAPAYADALVACAAGRRPPDAARH